MFPQQRRVAVVLGWGFGKVDGVGQHLEGADRRMGHFEEVAARKIVVVR